MRAIYIFCFLMALGVGTIAFAQNGNLYKIVTTEDFDEGFTLLKSADGGYLICGSTGAAEEGRASVYAVKTDSNGDYQWSTTLVADGNSRINDAVQASNGDFLLAGFSSAASGNVDGLVLRLSPAGEVIWSRYYGGSPNPDYINGISPASSFSTGFVLAGEQGRSNGKSDAWIFRIANDGNVVENYIDGGAGSDGFESVDVQTGFYAAAGFTESNSPDSGKIACRLRYYNFEFDEVGTYDFNEGNSCKIQKVAFIGDQAETGIAVEVENADSSYAFAAKYERTGGRQWSLTLDSANSGWSALQRDGAFGGVWAGNLESASGRNQPVFQSVETFNGIVDTLAVLSSPHDYIVRGLHVDHTYITMAGTRRKNGTSMGELFLVRTRKNGAFTNADSTLFIDDNFKIVQHSEERESRLKQSVLKLYPNPAGAFINMERSSSHPAEVRILNAAGVQLQTVRLRGSDHKHQLNISNLPAGFYFLQFIEREGKNSTIQMKSFIKQR